MFCTINLSKEMIDALSNEEVGRIVRRIAEKQFKRIMWSRRDSFYEAHLFGKRIGYVFRRSESEFAAYVKDGWKRFSSLEKAKEWVEKEGVVS